jgi:C1A family cysteine protease
MSRVNGWLPDKPDHRDVAYTSLRPQSQLLKAAARPRKVDLRGEHFPAIFDQGQIGSCVAQSWAAAIAHAISVEDFDKEGFEPLVMSRLFMYYNARGGKPIDEGCYIRVAIKMVANYGACLEEPYWPYVTGRWADRPSAAAYEEAAHRRIGLAYYRLNNSSLSDLLDCLAQGYPIVFGASIFQSFQEYDGSVDLVSLPRPHDAPLGGHAMTIVGYDMAKRAFLVRNSWGEDWGQKGYCWFPFKYLTNTHLADDFWTVRRVAR